MTHVDADLATVTERRLWPSAEDDPVLAAAIARLVAAGVYPVTPYMRRHGRDAQTMVALYGATWHCYAAPLACASCGADWRATQLGPPFKREWLETRLEEDRASTITCPDCGAVEPR